MATKVTDHALGRVKAYVESIAARARYTANGVVHNIPIDRTEHLADGRVAFYATIAPESTAQVIITRLALLDTGLNELMVRELEKTSTKDERVILNNPAEGALVRFTFTVRGMDESEV